MKIIVDQNIPFGAQAFGTIGDVEVHPGRSIGPETVRHAGALVVRSVTRIDARLLEGSDVRFVGTCTIGTDHVDVDLLRERAIAFASAPGCNANSVAEYVVAALLSLSRRGGRRLAGSTLGVVGVGNVGSKVAAKAAALGLRVLLNDPPLRAATGDTRYGPIEELFDADYLTLHVPLVETGPHPTRHMIDGALLSRLRDGVSFLNTARGAVVDERALASALDSGRVAAAALDVWENEPRIDPALVGKVALATPHIAGYSFDGKVLGTLMILRALCAHLGRAPSWDPAPLLPPPPHPTLEIAAGPDADPQRAIEAAVRALYDIERDDLALRRSLDLPEEERPASFDRLRRDYPVRREFAHTRIVIDPPRLELEGILAGIGFATAREPRP